MKRCVFLIALVGCLLLSAPGVGAEKMEAETTSPLEAVQALSADSIDKMIYTRYTEGGPLEGSVSDRQTLEEISKLLSKITLGGESNVATSDDGLYLALEADEETYELYFEGNNYVLGKKQYKALKVSSLKRFVDRLYAERGEEAHTGTEPTENRYQGWDYYNDYVYKQNKQPKYWIEFDGEFYLHCMFRSGSPEYEEVIYTLYPDWDAPCAQELTIRTVKDAKGNDISDWFEYLHFWFSYENIVFMEVKRNESTLAGGAEDNILTGDYVLLPPMVYPK